MARSDQLQDYSLKRSDALSLLVVVSHAGVLLATLYIAAVYATILGLLIFSVVFGILMNGFLNLMHECAHQHVFRNPRASVFLGRWIVSPMVVADFDAYQERHWRHHRKLGEAEDPKYAYRVSIRGVKLLVLLLRCLFLIEAVRKFSVQGAAVSSDQRQHGKGWLLRAMIVQLGIFTSVLLVAAMSQPETALRTAILSYGVVYVYGISAVTVFVASLRAIAEHQVSGDGAIVIKDAALRNFSSGASGFLLGSYGFTQHASHHKEPSIPYYRLKARTRQLGRENSGYKPSGSYVRTLIALARGSDGH